MSEDHENVSIWMLHPDIRSAPTYAFPAGYGMRFFEEGDIATWVQVQQRAEKYFTINEELFIKNYLTDSAKWAERIMFLVDPEGKAIGTITAWNDTKVNDRDMGQVHWVAIVPEAQGYGLAKPMLSAALDVMRSLNYTEAFLDTSSARVPAVNLYLHFGFKAFPREEVDKDAWRKLAPQLKYPI